MATREVEARRRNEQLVAQLVNTGSVHDPAVAGAFRSVLRHHFLPGRPLDEVYEDSAIMTKVGERGLPVSSSSQPTIMAIMLELLGPLPGHRVLEIGAGTGYNAALIAQLVAPGGRVVSVDIDPELARQARANLDEAHVEGVQVTVGDGAGGWPAEAPYDRVIVTAGADDLAPAWAEQLTDGGRLVLPLALVGPSQLCIAFVRRERSLTAGELCQCGFMPLRGDMAPAQTLSSDDLERWLEGPGLATGQSVAVADLRAGFETWLGLTAAGYVRARLRPDAAAAFGLRNERGVALVIGEGDGPRQPVVAFGNGESAVRELLAAHHEWRRERPSLERLRVVAIPSPDAPERPPAPDVRIVRRPRFTFVVSSA